MKAIVNLNKYVDNRPEPIVRLVIDVGTKKGPAIMTAIDKATARIFAVSVPVVGHPGVPDEMVEVEGWNLIDILKDEVPA